jgi:serine/threonine protein kinase
VSRSPRSRTGSELLPGDPAVLGPYKIVRRIGEGSYGVVFEGRDADDQPAAVKLLKSARVPAQERRRFEREVAALQTVNSPRVARYLAHGDSPGVWVAVEFVKGQTLWDAVLPPGSRGTFRLHGYRNRKSPLTGQELLEIVWQVLVGLRDLHGAGVTHRDLHPGNIMIRAWDWDDTLDWKDEPDAVLLDLGLSLQADERLTRAGEAIGHWQFTPPEQRGAVPSEWNPAADVYSWAATAAFAAQGYPPHTLSRVLEAPRSSAHPNLTGVPSDLARVLTGCLVEDPASRTSSDQLLRRLRALKAEWAHRDDEGKVDTRVLAAGFDEPREDGTISAYIDLEAAYLARSTWARVPLVGQGSELVAVSPGSTVTLVANRFGPAGNQDGALTGDLRGITRSSIHLGDGKRETPTAVCPACGSQLQRRNPLVQPGLFCENRLHCPQQVRHPCSHLGKQQILTFTVGAGTPHRYPETK